MTAPEQSPAFSKCQLTVSFINLAPETLTIIAQQFKGMPLILSKTEISIQNGSLSGSITLQALGS